jgi:hypothetical protein
VPIGVDVSIKVGVGGVNMVLATRLVLLLLFVIGKQEEACCPLG